MAIDQYVLCANHDYKYTTRDPYLEETGDIMYTSPVTIGMCYHDNLRVRRFRTGEL